MMAGEKRKGEAAVIVRLEEIAGALEGLFGPELAGDSRVTQAAAVPLRSWVPRQVPTP